MVPTKSFPARSSVSILVRLAKSWSIVPSKRFFCSPRNFKFARLPKDWGIVPVKSEPLSLSCARGGWGCKRHQGRSELNQMHKFLVLKLSCSQIPVYNISDFFLLQVHILTYLCQHGKGSVRRRDGPNQLVWLKFNFSIIVQIYYHHAL